jgi:hypothetical protein
MKWLSYTLVAFFIEAVTSAFSHVAFNINAHAGCNDSGPLSPWDLYTQFDD